MSFDVIESTIASAVAKSGTFDVGYPDDRDDGDYADGYDHRLLVNNAEFRATRGEISLSFGASNITVTYNGDTTIPSNTSVRVQLDRAGADVSGEQPLADAEKMARGETVIINLGAPIAADADGVCESQAGTADTPLTLDGALVVGGEAVFDVPRNVVAAWTTSATLTITGEDNDGNVIVETTPSAGTSHTGKKAFKKVTSVVPDTNITGVTVGTGDVLGLPVFLPSTAYILAELEDNAAASAGTAVAGVSAVATATTGDVRGTYDPASAADGAADFQLIAFLPDPSYKGVPQFGG